MPKRAQDTPVHVVRAGTELHASPAHVLVVFLLSLLYFFGDNYGISINYQNQNKMCMIDTTNILDRQQDIFHESML